jgi:hypothetical protein
VSCRLRYSPLVKHFAAVCLLLFGCLPEVFVSSEFGLPGEVICTSDQPCICDDAAVEAQQVGPTGTLVPTGVFLCPGGGCDFIAEPAESNCNFECEAGGCSVTVRSPGRFGGRLTCPSGSCSVEVQSGGLSADDCPDCSFVVSGLGELFLCLDDRDGSCSGSSVEVRGGSPSADIGSCSVEVGVCDSCVVDVGSRCHAGLTAQPCSDCTFSVANEATLEIHETCSSCTIEASAGSVIEFNQCPDLEANEPCSPTADASCQTGSGGECQGCLGPLECPVEEEEP